MKIKPLISFIFLIIPIAMTSKSFSEQFIKKPNVSGQFYDASALKLGTQVDRFVQSAQVSVAPGHVEMIVVPHAGYFYSGAVAGYGFKTAAHENYKTIVILAPSHHYGFDGISIWPKGAFETPLGQMPVDEEITQKLMEANKEFYFEPAAFEREHSLEVELPFLQRSFKNFKIVPVVMGQPTPELLNEFALVLKNVIGDRRDVLIVVSTDLSHYHDDTTAQGMDKMAIDAILSLDPQRVWKEAGSGRIEMCGLIPVVTALFYAKYAGLDGVELLKYANSSEASGDKERVVGYSAMRFYKSQTDKSNKVDGLSLEQKRELIKIAKETIEPYVRQKSVLEPGVSDERLKKIQGAFVTIHKEGALRGCIGNIIGRKPLYLTVRDMAIAAASQDPRFKPVGAEELNQIEVEVSVLSIPQKIKNVDEIIMGTHGVIISKGLLNHGVFLPQVATETGWSKEEFLSQLCAQKAGLPADCWKDPKTQIEIFSAEVFSEKDVR